MEDSAWAGIILAIIMIFFMFLPNYLFKPPSNHQEIRDNYLKDLIKKSEEELLRKEQRKKAKTTKSE